MLAKYIPFITGKVNQKRHPKKLKQKDESTIPVEIFIPKIAKEQQPPDELVTYSSKSRIKLARKARTKLSQRALHGLLPPSYDTSSTSSSTDGRDVSAQVNVERDRIPMIIGTMNIGMKTAIVLPTPAAISIQPRRQSLTLEAYNLEV